MTKYKTGSIYGMRAQARFVTENGAEIKSVEVAECDNAKAFEKAVKAAYERTGTDTFCMVQVVGNPEKVVHHFRVLKSDLVKCPSYEVID